MSEGALNQDFRSLEADAKRVGCFVVVPADNELLLDIDTDEQPILPFSVIDTLMKNGVHITSRLETVSRNGRRHVYLRLDTTLPVESRVALQALLGSDPKRETISVLRCRAMATNEDVLPTVLFETNEEAKRVGAWRQHCREFELDEALFS
jgi:hypothetical protein